MIDDHFLIEMQSPILHLIIPLGPLPVSPGGVGGSTERGSHKISL